MTRHTYMIERSRFGWWTAYNPEEPVGLIDSYTVIRSFTRERLVRKLERREKRARDRESSKQRQAIEIGDDE